MPTRNSIEHSGPEGVDSKENGLADKCVEDKVMLEEYMLETSFKNSALNEELLECLESTIKGSTMLLPQESDCSETDIKKCPKDVAQDITEQFKTPVKAVTQKSQLSQSKSPGLCSLVVQTQTPSKSCGKHFH